MTGTPTCRSYGDMEEHLPVEPRPVPEPSPDDPPQDFDEPDYDEIDREVARDAETQ
ncbi:hypothetical protein [Planotetraspora mira]|uniref:Uncharacterized protein n=1 Tax=Planotetraspora mira TaxID=58121 RepID=A0A8J3TWL5_9ACTN|nr:hypothetical protein [Planotetraspora mira]GII32682.1 hypothetical protein Pmi06nite_61240 [Planotetraspora mira]